MKRAVPVTFIMLFLLYAGCDSKHDTHQADASLRQPLSGLARVDSELAAMGRLMWDHRGSLSSEYADTFEMKMGAALQDPATFDYPFDSLSQANVHIVKSDDGKIRVLWWHDPWSGTWSRMPAMIQTLSASGHYTLQNARIFCEEESFPDVAYHHIYHMKNSLYLVLGGGKFMGKMPFQKAFGYILSDTGVSDKVNLFRTPGSRKLSSALYFDLLWALNKEEREMSDGMIFDSNLHVLTYPELIDTASGEIIDGDVSALDSVQPTGDTIRLRFNGRFFEEVVDGGSSR